MVLTQKGAKPCFPIFSYGENKFFFAKGGPWPNGPPKYATGTWGRAYRSDDLIEIFLYTSNTMSVHLADTASPSLRIIENKRSAENVEGVDNPLLTSAMPSIGHTDGGSNNLLGSVSFSNSFPYRGMP